MTYIFIFIAPLLNFLLFESFFFKAGLFYAALAVSDILLLIAVRQISGRRITSLEFWNFSIFPVLFSTALAAYSLFVVNQLITQILFAVSLCFNYLYLKNIYRGERHEFLESISSFGNLLTMFFSFSVIYGMASFLGWPIWILSLGSTGAALLVIYQIFWAIRIRNANTLAFIMLIGLLLTQLVWAIYFLPFNFNALGLIATVCYYLIIGLVKLSLAEKLTSRSLKFYLALGILFFALIFLTAKWA
ncbi:MAG TPA: hypothetical protein VMC41_01345 [Candidatus Nanoarchaeia archaeon]|nr:hypothetical protein [Candidatus Nanoarchaeia archaeon]